MGIIIGGQDSDSRVSPVTPMPTPENNILVALQMFAAGSQLDTATKTIARSAGNELTYIR
jgi:hypothetical protein